MKREIYTERKREKEREKERKRDGTEVENQKEG